MEWKNTVRLIYKINKTLKCNPEFLLLVNHSLLPEKEKLPLVDIACQYGRVIAADNTEKVYVQR